MMTRLVKCKRCAGSGSIGIRTSSASYVGPGPVPEDARGICEIDCLACCGEGEIPEDVDLSEFADDDED